MAWTITGVARSVRDRGRRLRDRYGSPPVCAKGTHVGRIPQGKGGYVSQSAVLVDGAGHARVLAEAETVPSPQEPRPWELGMVYIEHEEDGFSLTFGRYAPQRSWWDG